MVKPSNPEATARRDGWLERKGTWGEVTIGSLLAGRNRTDVWEVTDMAHPPQVQFGHTLWFKMVNRTTGEILSVPPKLVKHAVTFLMKDDSEAPPPRTPPGDSDAVLLLAQTLGASVLASRDNATGEITCPDYAAGGSVGDNRYGREEMEHLRICHGMDVSGIELLPSLDQAAARITAHGRAHDPKHVHVGKGGFPHRHVPEDLSIL